MASSTEIEEFMTGPLVTWFYSCLETEEHEYEDLVDGGLLYEVLLQIDPEPPHHGVIPSLGNPLVRVRNLDIIIRNIKTLFEEELCQVVLVLPDCVRLGQQPDSKVGLENMQLLLLLLLGCAVQCPNKEVFIERIKEMDVDVQLAIVDCIKQVTENPQLVLTQDVTAETLSSSLMLSHVRRLAKERDEYHQNWASTLVKADFSLTGDSQRKLSTQVSGSESHHLAVELADWKARLRKQRQELEEKSEALAETKEELEYNKILAAKLKQEVQELKQDARAAKAYRDELDAVRERAERVDKLEVEVQRYREKLSDIEFYKTRVDELREDNKVLMETREMLEDQLQRARKRGDHALQLEGEIIKYKQHVNELILEKEACNSRLQEVVEENTQLQLLTRSVLNESAESKIEYIEEPEAGSGDNSLSEQLSSNAQARALKLELENRKLMSTIDSLRESSLSEFNNKVLELEKEKKRLSIKVEQLQESNQQVVQQNSDLEQLFKDSLSENRRLQDVISHLRQSAEKHCHDIQAERTRLEEFEKNIDILVQEKQRLQGQVETLNNQLEENGHQNESLKQQLSELKIEAEKAQELQSAGELTKHQLEVIEKENNSLMKDVSKLKDLLEEKDKAIDKYSCDADNSDKEICRLGKELEEAATQIARLQEVEREGQELASRAAADREALATLQVDLVQQKVLSQQLKATMEKIGIDFEQLLDPENLISTIISSNEIKNAVRELLVKEMGLNCNCKISKSSEKEPKSPKCQQCDDLRQELLSLQAHSEALRSESATLQVDKATLQSQIVSLSTQHMALQLANSQLAAEKEEMVKEKCLQESAHEQLLLDQVTLQSLHEHLSEEYEAASKERELLRSGQRDLRSEIRQLREMNEKKVAEAINLQEDRDKLRLESQSLSNLRAEHSSLKDDFRYLFTANEKLKQEFRNLQEEHRSLRMDSGNVKLRATEMQGELSALEVELSKMTHRCEILQQMNVSLEDDRRSLMENISLMFTQYHELLTHSLEDKEHYHQEEKIFTDKFNNLCRQKEKLEEKIMEHYRKLDSCSTKKKSLGATFVKRAKKLGSDIMNKVPRNRQSWHEDSHRIESQSRIFFGSESGEGGNDSDTSVDDTRNVRESRNSDGFNQSSLSLGGAGTRRAVYYAEESNGNQETPQDNFTKTPGDSISFDDNASTEIPRTSTPQHDTRPLLVYNRITTVIEAPEEAGMNPRETVNSQGSLTPQKLDSKRSTNKAKGKGENSTWYEYGCV